MKKVVVIGGAGFIGSHTADELSERGFEVIIFDVQEPVWLRNDQRFVRGSTLDLLSVESVLDGADYVYHFAGVADIGDAIRRPYEASNVNVMGTTCILEAIQNQIDTQHKKNYIHIGIDKGAISYRKRIDELIKFEAGDNKTTK